MHGKVLAILVAPGEAVAKGQRLAMIEAMKMEHALIAPCDGIVGEIVVGGRQPRLPKAPASWRSKRAS